MFLSGFKKREKKVAELFDFLKENNILKYVQTTIKFKIQITRIGSRFFLVA